MQERATHDAYVAVGSNLDDPAEQVRSAMDALGTLVSTRLLARSSLYRSAPWGYAEQPDFINAVAHVVTALNPSELLAELLALENARGRVRSVPNGPRVIDLDLLLFDGACIEEPDLVVPHPRMHQRAFVLVPLLEIAPEACVPGHGAAADLVRVLDLRGLERIVHA